jgi:hypothetical protein
MSVEKCPPHDYAPMGGGGAICNKCKDIVPPVAQGPLSLPWTWTFLLES